MTDWHVHFGLFRGQYYDYHDVFSVLANNRVDNCYCAVFTPKHDDVSSSLAFFKETKQLTKEAKAFAATIDLGVNLLCWIDPLLLRENLISVDEYFHSSDYRGIAIHPFHSWRKAELLSVFQFADIQRIPVFLHTGVSPSDLPTNFEFLFEGFPGVEVHLAHCKESRIMIGLFSKYGNLFGDTAFCPRNSYEEICDAGFSSRMLFGSDFPATHWYDVNYSQPDMINDHLSLNDSYVRTLKQYDYVFSPLIRQEKPVRP